MSIILDIKDLHASVDDKPILKGLTLQIKEGETHAIMGPNGSGKSTLGYLLSGKPGYSIDSGSIIFRGEDLTMLSPQERALKGLFLAFQYPVEIPGVNNLYFLKAAVNNIREARGEEPLDAIDFMSLAKAKMAELEMDERFSKRAVNEGFSGGEKKRNEMLQMLMLEPQLCILDETDSGLDIDALQIVANSVNSMRDDKRAFIVVTHYQRLLNHIVPDVVHVLADGKIVQTGDKSLAHTLEEQGYSALTETES